MPLPCGMDFAQGAAIPEVESSSCAYKQQGSTSSAYWKAPRITRSQRVPANAEADVASPRVHSYAQVWLTAYLELVWLGKLRKGDDLLIHAGASGVGSAAIQLAKALGARTIVTAGSSDKLQHCRASPLPQWLHVMQWSNWHHQKIGLSKFSTILKDFPVGRKGCIVVKCRSLEQTLQSTTEKTALEPSSSRKHPLLLSQRACQSVALLRNGVWMLSWT